MRLRWVYYSEDNIITFSNNTNVARSSATAELLVKTVNKRSIYYTSDKHRLLQKQLNCNLF